MLRKGSGDKWSLYIKPGGVLYLASQDGRVPSGQNINISTAIELFTDMQGNDLTNILQKENP